MSPLWMAAALAAPPLVEAWVQSPDGKPEIVLQIRADEAVEITPPSGDGVTLGAMRERVEVVGGLTVTTRTWQLQPRPGSAVLSGACATAGGGEPVCAEPVYVDFGKAPDRPGMADIVEPGRLWSIPWLPIFGAVAVLGILVAWARRARSKPPAPVPAGPPEPHDARALRRWAEVQADTTLDDLSRAEALSEIFREYVEAALAFPARSWSTTETLAHLGRLAHLARENVPRARSLLRATDRVKYADVRPGADLFEELDADLRAFIDSTRPRAWEGR